MGIVLTFQFILFLQVSLFVEAVTDVEAA